ncbi:uncharacterized protein LOC135692359 [Rhopilema esculentum]|uniref:uncharacterized protein LOC135692359 n=1 Tax=Rhopilema esculentum TaxID=499914 RepID=UPI0031D58A0B
MDWSKVEGAHSKKRVVILRETKDKTFRCPIEFCENRTFFSKRGCRKHIDTKHRWYYFFDVKPSDKVIERSAEQSTQRSHKHIESARRRADTTKRPHFSISEGVGKQYVDWLCAVCGGGLSAAQATQNATRVMKFLKFCSEDDEDNLTEQHVDYSIGSAGLICSFIEHIGKEWGLGSSAQFGYLQAITDLIDFRKSSGLSATVLGNLAVSEVYINRGKKALAKRKISEWSKNLSIEVLSGCNQWATMEEMERVIPYHLPRYKDVLTNCKGYPLTAVTPADLTFATRFVAVYMFTRVKGSRPMTYQFLTVSMFEKSRENNGFVDQTEFKTAQQYTFDSLILDETSTRLLDDYICHVRPLLNPQCEYVLVTRNGTQFKQLSNLMSELVFQAIGKYVHPTRYRQIVETESSRKLSAEEQEVVSRDQKHSSQVAKTYYQKRNSREIAVNAKSAMKKLQNKEVDRSLKRIILDNKDSSDQDCCLEETEQHQQITPGRNRKEKICVNLDEAGNESCRAYSRPDCNADRLKAKPVVSRRVPFTPEEDFFLKKSLKVYGFGKWTAMLKDPRFNFNSKRTPDSLKKRAELLAKK